MNAQEFAGQTSFRHDLCDLQADLCFNLSADSMLCTYIWRKPSRISVVFLLEVMNILSAACRMNFEVSKSCILPTCLELGLIVLFCRSIIIDEG